MRGRSKFIFIILFLAVFVSFPMDSQAAFYPLKDTESSNDKPFKDNIQLNKNIEFVLGRVHIDGPYYDGLDGYNVIFLREFKKPALAGPNDVFTKLVNSQLYLFGFQHSDLTVYAYKMGQHGAEFRISNIIAFSPQNPNGLDIGPSGGFQYGSPSPDGVYCILVDSRVIVVNLGNGKWHEIEPSVKLTNIEADPFRQIKGGTSIGGSANLSGEFMEMVWTSSRTGKLVIKDKSGSLAKEISISIKE